MIIITGTGRSGTNLFVSALAHAGVETGPTSGFGEHLEAIEINRIILKARGYFAWERTAEMVDLIGHGIRKLDQGAIKQTDLCHTLDVWWKSRQDLEVIVCHRRLDSTRRSFAKQSGLVRQDLTASSWPSCTTEVSTDAWMAFCFGQLMDILLTENIPHRLFHFPEDLEDLAGSWYRLSPILHSVMSRQQFLDSMEHTINPAEVHWR